MKTLARRVRRLEEALQRAAAPSARLFWDDEVVACGQHPGTQIKREVALAMPPPVAGVYLAHPDALPLHDCEDCGYGVPHE